MSTAAELLISIRADISSLSAQLQQATQQLSSAFLPGHVGAELIADGIKEIGSKMWDFAKESVDALAEVERLSGQTAAAIASTGGAAGVTLGHITDLAGSIEHMTGIEAESIQAGENMLLTFTNIKNGVGAGNDIFDQATGIMADLAQAMGGDTKGAAIQLGKALNDPITGVSALSRVGVTFTDGQKETIKALVESGHVMEAQKIVLAELGREFGGSAKAFGETLPGLMAKFDNALGDVGEAVMGTFVPQLKGGLEIATNAFLGLAQSITDHGIVGGIVALFGPEVKAMILGVAGAITAAMWPAIEGMAMAAWGASAAFVAAASSAIVAWAPFIGLAAAIAFAATPIIKYWDDLSFEFGRIWEFVSKGAGDFVNWVAKGFQHLANNVVGPVARFISDKLSALWGMLPQQAKDALKGVGIEFNGLGANLGGALQVAGVAIGGGAKFIAGNMVESFSGWGDMFNGAGALVSKLTQGVTTDFSKLAKGVTQHAEAVGNAAGGAAKAVKGHAGAMSAATKAAVDEMKASLERGQEAIAAFSSRIQVLTAMSQNLKDLQRDARLFGDGFVSAADAADVVKKAITGLLDQGVSEASPMVQNLVKQWHDYDDAAKAATASTFDVSKEMGDVAKALSIADTKGKVFGKTFDVTAAKTQILHGAIEKLVENGFGPMSAEVKALTGQLDDLGDSNVNAVYDLGTFKQSTTDVLTAVQGLKEGVSTIAQALGIEMGTALLDGVAQWGNFALALVQVGTSVQALIPALLGDGKNGGLLGAFVSVAGQVAGVVGPALLGAMEAIGTAVTGAIASIGDTLGLAVGASGPIGLAIAAVVALGIGLAANWENVSRTLGDTFDGITQNATDMFLQTQTMLVGMANAFARFFDRDFAGVDAAFNAAWGAVVQLKGGVDQLGQKMMDLGKQSAATAAQMKAFLSSVNSSFDSGITSAIRSYLDGTKPLMDGLREGIKNAIIDGILQSTLQKAMFEGPLKSLIDQFATAAYYGKDTSSIVAQLNKQIPAVANNIESALGPLKGMLSKVFPDTSKAATSSSSSSGGDAWAKAYSSFASSQSGADRWTFDQFFNAMGGKLPALAAGGLASSATLALIGEGAHQEAVLPLSPAVFSQIASGIAGALPAPAGAGGGDTYVTLNVKVDSREAGEMLVKQLRQLGIKV